MNLSEAQKTLIAKLGKDGLPRTELSAEECRQAYQLGKCGAVILRWKGLAEDRYAATQQGLAAIKPPECAPMAVDVGSQAARDVLAERRRQVEAEGWTPEHDDDAHDHGDLAAAAAAYAFIAADHLNPHSQGDGGNEAPDFWPFEPGWWKPGEPRRNLVKAGALILAEIERFDRVSMQEGAR